MTGMDDEFTVIRYRCATCGGTGVDSLGATCADCDGTGADNHGA
jgi:DnaJ-class molecular chaperone